MLCSPQSNKRSPRLLTRRQKRNTNKTRSGTEQHRNPNRTKHQGSTKDEANDNCKANDNHKHNDKHKPRQERLQMDMTRHLKRHITNAELERRGGRYAGEIASVVEEMVHNRFTFKHKEEPVITFSDGVCWVPNFTARRVLVEQLGPETDEWVGQWIAVSLETVARSEKTSGRLTERLQKRVTLIPSVDLTQSEDL